MEAQPKPLESLDDFILLFDERSRLLSELKVIDERLTHSLALGDRAGRPAIRLRPDQPENGNRPRSPLAIVRDRDFDGSTGAFAKHLKLHPTYVSQLISGRSVGSIGESAVQALNRHEPGLGEAQLLWLKTHGTPRSKKRRV
jgi:hypothetical protein